MPSSPSWLYWLENSWLTSSAHFLETSKGLQAPAKSLVWMRKVVVSSMSAGMFSNPLGDLSLASKLLTRGKCSLMSVARMLATNSFRI